MSEDPAERQAEALEAIADQLAYQNAVLTELARATHQVAERTGGQPVDPDYTTPTPKSLQTWIDDHAYSRQERENR